ncbi:MAG: DUF1925 domain-containing protein [Candidatus Dormibacteraeota bacterium]|nr:DUF1925 domain-containing protein [Candidatus Dormibacteraeota bacterium]
MAEAPRLALVVHFHQPVDNLERVVARAARRCYLPFLEAIARHPEVPFTLHYSGCLLAWLERLAPVVLERLQERVRAGQVELLGGGLEEPILASLPERDRAAQIARMASLLESWFGQRPRGLWLAERVWEPDLASTLSRSGIHYAILDDTTLRAVGVEEDRLGGVFVTEHQGLTVRILAASRRLRYRIPYSPPQSVVGELVASPPGWLSLYADDGEKFGEWPGTSRQVYRRRWLERFLERLREEAHGGRLRLVQAGQAAREGVPTTVQLPSSSYDEMMTWALPTPVRHRLELASAGLAASDPLQVAPYVRGAPWRGFQAKYPEVARLQQQMVRVSGVVASAGGSEAAVAELHRGQCNCGYWHGTFGGAYLTFLRLGLWHHLVRAERTASRPRQWGVEVTDLDGDGLPELRIFGPWGYATVDSHLGGQVVELVSWAAESNLVAVMGRHLEAYHLEARAASLPAQGMELAPLEAPSGVSTSQPFDVGEVGALRDSVNGVVWDLPYDVEVLPTGAVLSAERDGLRLRKWLTATELGLRASYRLDRDGSPASGLAVEVRACPWAPGRKADSVAVRSFPGGVRVMQVGATGQLAIRGHFDHSWERIVAVGSTLSGVERLVQGAAVSVVPQAAAGELEIELVPEVAEGSQGRGGEAAPAAR